MGEFENLEGLCWENFFDQVDKQFEEVEGESKWNGGGSNEIVAFSGVATLPHDSKLEGCTGSIKILISKRLYVMEFVLFLKFRSW